MEGVVKIGFIYRDPKGGGTSIENVFTTIKDYLSLKSKNTYVNICIDRSLSFFENRRLILSHQCDLYHITGDVYYYAPLLWPARVTQTIHDFVTFKKYSRLKK